MFSLWNSTCTSTLTGILPFATLGSTSDRRLQAMLQSLRVRSGSGSARINYEAETKVISVHATSAEGKFEVSFVYDLGALLPEQVQVGLAGSTGLYVAVHDVVSWYFSSTLVHDHMNEFEGAKTIHL
ncbi:lectin 9-like [Salvia hispanica]|uniref:lectin 9-like n=1 Tax=Salvia hispanica TaxID=49212 RepID=UPI002009DA7A|nr:lectin 9-like [Salvia hispanica]